MGQDRGAWLLSEILTDTWKGQDKDKWEIINRNKCHINLTDSILT